VATSAAFVRPDGDTSQQELNQNASNPEETPGADPVTQWGDLHGKRGNGEDDQQKRYRTGAVN